jgi:hypothetical protein
VTFLSCPTPTKMSRSSSRPSPLSRTIESRPAAP